VTRQTPGFFYFPRDFPGDFPRAPDKFRRSVKMKNFWNPGKIFEKQLTDK
jgi:hypothetical protein